MVVDSYNLTASVFNVVYQGTAFISDLLSAIISGIGLYLLIKKRKSIRGFLKILTNFSLQNTISELHQKLNKLNEFSADDSDIRIRCEIECIMHEINGQIEGNAFLKTKFVDEQNELKKYMLNPEKLSEPLKRGLVSMIREKLKSINIETYSDFTRGEDE